MRTCEAEARGLQVFAILAGRSSCNLQEVPLSTLRLSLPLPLRQRQRESSERTERHHPRTTPAIPFPRDIIEVDVGWRLRKLRVSCTGEADGDGASAVKHDDILPWEERRITGIYADHRTASSGDS